jgi:hypothetical protein
MRMEAGLPVRWAFVRAELRRGQAGAPAGRQAYNLQHSGQHSDEHP